MTLGRFFPLACVVAGSFAFRFPALLNARGVNSDAAVVGLQAMHILRGEHAVFLWGSGYQTSVDSYFAAALFAIFGATPLVLVLSALVLFVVLTVLAFDVLRRHVQGEWLAAALVLPLVFSTAAVDSFALNPPRQASLTLAMAAIALADRRRAFFAGVVALLAFYADPYALLMIPAVAIVVGTSRPKALLPFAGGGALGAIPVFLRMRHADAQHGIFSMTTGVLAHNAKLLVDPCGPWFLGTTIWTEQSGTWGPWHAPIVLRALQLAGGAAFFLVIGASLVIVWRTGHALKRLALGGAAVMLVTLGGFLVSQMVMDSFSMRYLAAVALVMPFVAAPIAARIGRGRFLGLWAPYVATSALCGWLTFTPYVDGPFPVRDPAASGAAEQELAAGLAERGVTHAVADYWAAYRITFVTGEKLTVVPLHDTQDRHAAYREALERSDKFAYVYDPRRSGEDEAATVREYAATYDTIGGIDTGSLRAVILARKRPIAHATTR